MFLPLCPLLLGRGGGVVYDLEACTTLLTSSEGLTNHHPTPCTWNYSCSQRNFSLISLISNLIPSRNRKKSCVFRWKQLLTDTSSSVDVQTWRLSGSRPSTCHMCPAVKTTSSLLLLTIFLYGQNMRARLRVCACVRVCVHDNSPHVVPLLTSCPSGPLRAPYMPTRGLTWSSAVVSFS